MRSIAGMRGDNGVRETLEELIEETEHDHDRLSDDERTMFRNLLEFGELTVEDVMVPRADIVGVPEDASLDTVIATMSDAGHSRLPVFRGSLDTVVGMVHVRDLLCYWQSRAGFDLPSVVRPLLFVPPSMLVLDLLRRMRASKVHMALVIDEHGGTDGLATIEDLVEEIVGEIEDEHDVGAEPSINEVADGVLEADARLPVPALEAMIETDLLPADREDDIDTLGGLVFDLAGRVPEPGEIIRHPAGLAFEVIEADPRRIHRLRIRQIDGADTAPA
jgi:CBS domain containing-hemolysin-like protein